MVTVKDQYPHSVWCLPTCIKFKKTVTIFAQWVIEVEENKERNSPRKNTMLHRTVCCLKLKKDFMPEAFPRFKLLGEKIITSFSKTTLLQRWSFLKTKQKRFELFPLSKPFVLYMSFFNTWKLQYAIVCKLLFPMWGRLLAYHQRFRSLLFVMYLRRI